MEIKQCQNCKVDFTIEPDDFAFYEKISVPPPTFCPECRLQRRLTFRNEVNLHKRKCDLCEEEIIAMYPENTTFPVYCRDCWWSDRWNPLEYGNAYDFSADFFTQYSRLQQKVPRVALVNAGAVNSEWCNYALDNKNCYLCASIAECENVFYSIRNIVYNKDCIDLIFSRNNELCYDLLYTIGSYQSAFATDCEGCISSMLIEACKNCQSCFGCTNLRNKKYYIFNKPYTKEEYGRKVGELNLGSYANLQTLNEAVTESFRMAIRRYAIIERSVNCRGDRIHNSKNCLDCFLLFDSEDCRFISVGGRVKNSYDVTYSHNTGSSEFCYETLSLIDGQKVRLTFQSWTSNEVTYTDACHSSSNLFGCISLRNKQYCILNTQYTKEEYEELVPRIIKHMNEIPYVSEVRDQKSEVRKIVYRYGEFFPPELSPFAYNETIAQEYFPLTKEEAISKGYRWRDPEERHYEITKRTEDLPDHIKDVSDSITGEIIQCQHYDIASRKIGCNEQCTTAFKIIPDELQFYRRMNLPLPRLCPNCRHYQRLKQRNPLKLWHRTCQCAGMESEKRKEDGYVYQNTIAHFHSTEHCPNEFETSYAPDRPEIVYCEQCYNSEVV